MQNKSQRIRITEKGWAGYNGHFGGVEFKNGLSTEIVDPAQMIRLGSIIGIRAVDTDEEAGAAASMQRMSNVKAEVKETLPRGVAQSVKAEKTEEKARHTREELEEIADKQGISGLRAIADPLGVKGRGIAELISEILAAE